MSARPCRLNGRLLLTRLHGAEPRGKRPRTWFATKRATNGGPPYLRPSERFRMAKRANPRGCQLVRGFLMGLAYGSGHTLTTARIRKLGASRATAKRYMKVIRKLVPVPPSKPLLGMLYHVAQRTKAGTR